MQIPILLHLALAIMTPLFFFGGPDYYSPRHFKELWNLGHIIYFALFALFIRLYTNKWRLGFFTRLLLILGLTLFVGAAIELIQAGFHRTPDIGDLIRDLVGAMVGIVFLLPERKTLSKVSILALKSITTVLVLFQLYPVIIAYSDAYFAHSRFPVLSDFETPFERERWIGGADFSIDETVKHSGQRSLKVVLKTTRYSGVSLHDFPGDWEGYRQFQFSVYNPSSQPIRITCRINDRIHYLGSQDFDDRFNRNYSLPQGWSTIAIDLEDVRHAPRQRRMDMRQIHGLMIFATALENPRLIYIDDVRLRNSDEPVQPAPTP